MVTINKDAELNFDFAIIGGGPAGMAAAIQAAKHGVKIALLDERVTLGGQIYKQLGRGFKIANQTQLQVPPKIGQNLIADFDKQNISLFLKSAVVS